MPTVATNEKNKQTIEFLRNLRHKIKEIETLLDENKLFNCDDCGNCAGIIGMKPDGSWLVDVELHLVPTIPKLSTTPH